VGERGQKFFVAPTRVPIVPTAGHDDLIRHSGRTRRKYIFQCALPRFLIRPISAVRRWNFCSRAGLLQGDI
jgi:hypothetical protein